MRVKQFSAKSMMTALTLVIDSYQVADATSLDSTASMYHLPQMQITSSLLEQANAQILSNN